MTPVSFTENPFEKLPREVLLHIVKSSTNLSSLNNLTKASPAISSLLSDCGAEIIEAVISTSLPYHIRALIRLIALIRTSSLGCSTIAEFSRKYIGRHKKPTVPALSPNLSPAELRGILASAHQIYLLTHSCLQYYINISLSIQPAHVVDKDKFSYARAVNQGQRHWTLRPESRRYQPQNSGPPSWIEEQRAARGLWWVQVFYDLINAGLEWPEEDIEKLKRDDIEGLGFDMHGEGEELKTVIAYLMDGRFKKIDEYASQPQLPWPSQEIDVYWSSPEPIFENFQDDLMGEGIIQLDLSAHAVNYATSILSTSLYSPIQDVTFEPFRKFGFALWDDRRMVALGLLAAPEDHKISRYVNHGGLFYTWRSILGEEEVVRIEREMEEARLLRSNSLRPGGPN